MTNHPNRNWRRVMTDAATAYLGRYRWPEGGIQALTPDQLRQLLLDAYLTGYTEGRASRAVRHDPC